MLLEAAWTYGSKTRGSVLETNTHRLNHEIEGVARRLIYTVPSAADTAADPGMHRCDSGR